MRSETGGGGGRTIGTSQDKEFYKDMSRYRGGKHCGCLHRPSSISLPLEAPANTCHACTSSLPPLPTPPSPGAGREAPRHSPPPPEGNWTGWLPPPRTLNKRDQRRANQYSAATGYNDRVGTTATTAAIAAIAATIGAIAAIANAIGIIGIIGNKQVDMGRARGNRWATKGWLMGAHWTVAAAAAAGGRRVQLQSMIGR